MYRRSRSGRKFSPFQSHKKRARSKNLCVPFSFQRNHFLILYHATQSLPRGGRWAGRKPGSDEGDLPQGIGCVLRQHVKMPFPPWCLASPDGFNLSFETLSSYVGTLRTACATLPSSVRFAATFVQGRFYQFKLSPGQFDPRGRLFYEQR